MIQHAHYSVFIETGIPLPEGGEILGISCGLKPGCVVKGLLMGEEGAWNESGWHVIPEVLPIGAYRFAGGKVSNEGEFELKGLPPGPLKLIVHNKKEKVFETSVTLPLAVGETLILKPLQ